MVVFSDDRDILSDAGKISMEIAKDRAESEYEKYRIIQDQLYESDFDKLIQDAKKIMSSHLNYSKFSSSSNFR